MALSRDPGRSFAHARRASSLPEALELARAFDGEIWICGGQAIYEEAMPLTDRLYLTLIDAEYKGDVFFPAWEHLFTRELSRREISIDGVAVSFLELAKANDGVDE